MITLDRASPISLYEQLYRELKKAIISGELPPGKQLPSTRALALQYDISRNTVNTAYSQLLVEGFITSRPGSGFYLEKIPLPVTLNQTTPSAIPEAQSPSCTYDFSYGSLDVNIYRNRAFRQAMSRAWNNMEKRNSIPYEPAAGSLHLREAITHMLHSSRGVVATPNQIILTSGHYYSLFLLTAFFSSSHYSLILEDPGYPAVRDIFQKENFSIHAIPAKKTGIDTAPLHQYTNALLYITPSHQYPLGSILPIKKRMEILNWAVQTNSYIIENDYDSELHYRDMPIPSLQSIDSNHRVIYLGTFSKSISPDIRASYLVMPENFPLHLKERFPRISASLPQLMEETLAYYLESDAWEKHLNIIRSHFRKKHDAIIAFLKKHFGEKITIHGIGGGVHFVLELKSCLSAEQMIAILNTESVQVYNPAMFWSHPEQAPKHMLLMGYGGIPEDELPDYLAALRKGLNKIFDR